MFFLTKLETSIIIPAEEYTHGPNKSIKYGVFKKYLYKIVSSIGGVCVKIKSIEAVDNVILRKTADMKVDLVVELVMLRLNEE